MLSAVDRPRFFVLRLQVAHHLQDAGLFFQVLGFSVGDQSTCQCEESLVDGGCLEDLVPLRARRQGLSVCFSRITGHLGDLGGTHNQCVQQWCGLSVIRHLVSFENVQKMARPARPLDSGQVANLAGREGAVYVALVTVVNPSVIIADEPTADLDPISAQAILKILSEERDRGAMVVAVLHAPDQNIEGAEEIAMVER